MGLKFVSLLLALTVTSDAYAGGLRMQAGWPLPIAQQYLPETLSQQEACKDVGKQPDGSYQFLSDCPGRSLSPDGRFALVQKIQGDNQLPVEFQDAQGRTLVKLPSLTDDMPYAATWSPNSRWIMVNHHVGSFMDELQLFEVIGHSAVERSRLVKSAARLATRRYPCLPRDMVLPNGVRWSRDSRRIILVTVSAPYSCTIFGRRKGGTWHSLLMIGDVATGRIEPGSVRVQPDNKPFETPKDDVYSAF